ncbi:MAG: HAD hydrolase-like protein [Lachnospiraceae bacterium]|nr:HAD hydrolase-like protein [Lachnospiraceae bacterium]
MRHYDTILFDLDGTLTESAPGIVNAVLYALKKNGIEETDREKLMTFVGPPLYDSFQKHYGMSKQQADHMVDDFREYYHERGWKENSPYEGVPEMLQTLRAQGRKLAVATSKPEVTAKQILSFFGLTEYFDLIAGATMDDSRSRKGDVIAYAVAQLKAAAVGEPEKAEAEGELKKTAAADEPEKSETGRANGTGDHILMVGDRSHDVAGAKENGLPCVGVLYGYGSREELEEAEAAAICTTVEDLPDVIAGLERE